MSSVGCSSDPANVDPGNPPANENEAGTDSGGLGERDAGHDSGRDAGQDSGSDSGADAGPSCAKPEDCPEPAGECVERTCKSGVCGEQPVAAGTAIATQTAGDCKRAQCDDSGKVASVDDDTDVSVDANDCTDDVCTAGVPSNPRRAVGSACGLGNALKCDEAGACVGCLIATDCAGDDTECSQRTCTAGTCGRQLAPAGTALAAQVSGDCKKVVCDGAGNSSAQNDDTDVGSDDNVCTGDVCTGGVLGHPNVANGTVCAAGKGCLDGLCAGCAVASDCAGADDDCKRRTCTAGQCGFQFTAAGTPTASQQANDCKRSECDGEGNIASANDDGDRPSDDGSQCTSEICTNGAASHPNVASGVACNQNGGTFCDGAGACVAPSCTDGVQNGTETGIDCGGGCPACPTNVIVVPSDGDANVAVAAPITITFATPMTPASLTAQPTSGACTGSLQVSSDSFATCIGFAPAAIAVGDTEVTLTPAPGFAYGSTYKVRVTADARNAGGAAFTAYTMPAGFSTVLPDTSCLGSVVVISQIYGGGGNAGAPFKNDFIELHNRGGAAVSLAGWSVQYASAAGDFNGRVNLTGSIAAGGYYLIQAGGGANGAALPAADLTAGGINLSGTVGKVALVSGTAELAECSGATAIDVIGYGTTASCSEGARAPAPSATTAAIRKDAGCRDAGDNASDFVTAAPTPRNSASPASTCACTLNESNAPKEADYCVLQSPASIVVTAGTSTPPVFGRIYELGATEAAGAPAELVAQVGYGPENANPQTQSGWSWINATYNVQAGDDDEYQATFTPTMPGTYRYAYRFSLDRGVSFTYCDVDGAGSNAGQSFETTKLPILSVVP